MTTNREKIQNLHNNGIKQINIAMILGISRQRVHQIINSYRTLDNRQTIKKIVFNKFHYKCVLCKDNKNCEIHHIDNNSSNNSIENLILLCRKCHKNIHKKINACVICNKKSVHIYRWRFGYKIICFHCYNKLKKHSVSRWSYRYNKCIDCGKVKNKHASNGLCTSCYIKKRYKENPEKYKEYSKNRKLRNAS